MPAMPPRGRGAADNPANRFESLHIGSDPDFDGEPPDAAAVPTLFFRDPSRSLIASNDSPDVGFEKSINPYRGCEHGCCYCHARTAHEYLGFSAGLDFETRILVKEDAPEILRRELSASSWKPQVVALSGVTDPYQPVERRLGLTRRCLEVLRDFRNPVEVVTKSDLVLRDLDLLADLASHDAAAVSVSTTTLDAGLAASMEPRAPRHSRRLHAIEELAHAGIPVRVLVAPVIPGLNDSEIPAILNAAASAGARAAGYVMLRLPHGLKGLFDAWLARHAPLRRDKVLHRLRELRGGNLYDARYGTRMRGTGIWADQIARVFAVAARRAGLADRGYPELSTRAFRRPSPSEVEGRGQMALSF